jgi:hypothetical protein
VLVIKASTFYPVRQAQAGNSGEIARIVGDSSSSAQFNSLRLVS